MAAPTWVAAGTKSERSVNTGTTSTVAPPAGHATGDLLVIAAHTSQNRTISTPAGWTLLYDSGVWGGVNQFRSYLFRKFAASGSEPSVTITTSAAAYCDSQMYAFRGVDATTPIDAAVVAGAVSTTASVPTPAITTVTNDALMVYIGFDISSTNWTTPPAGATERSESATFLGKFTVATETKTTAGTEAADAYTRTSIPDSAFIAGFALRASGAVVGAAFVPQVIVIT